MRYIYPLYSFYLILLPITFLNNKIPMIAAQLPSLEQIYDYSSNDLKKIVQELNSRILGNPNDHNLRQSCQSYIENINIELEERKTLQFFQQMCAVDNPYLQKVADFNNQLLKLAEKAIAEQQSNQQNHEKMVQIQQRSKKSYVNHEANDATSVTSHAAYTEVAGSQTNQRSDKPFTVSSLKRSSNDKQKKMGIGNQQSKTKNAMKDFILSTLTKNKAEGCYVIKKGGPPKPQASYTVNQRGHLVSSNTLQPISTKNIKTNSVSKPQPSPISSNKNINDFSEKINEKDLEKRRQQAIQKVKGNKAQKKKQKHLNNKDLVQMIRQQQRLKVEKQNKKDIQNSIIKNQKVDQKQNKKESKNQYQKQKINTQLTQIKQQTQNKSLESLPYIAKQQISKMLKQDPQQILQQIQVQQGKGIPEKMLQHTQEKELIEQIIAIDSQQNIISVKQTSEKIVGAQKKAKLADQTKNIQKASSSNIIKVQVTSKDKQQPFSTVIIESTSRETEKVKGQINRQQQMQNQPKSIEQNKSNNLSHQQTNHYLQQYEELKQMKKQFQSQIIIEKYQPKYNENENFGRIVDIPQQTSPSEDLQTPKSEKNIEKQNINKKCYNEEYWIHIREQAEHQITRMKQQKEIEQLERKKAKNNIQRSISNDIPNNTDQQYSQRNGTKEQKDNLDKDNILAPLQQIEEDQFVEMRKKELKKMINDHNKRKIPKRASAIIVAPAKQLYVLPTFNYLQIYPTFNHIFSVMYTKIEHQALMDIPLIMKQLITMFSTHINYFKDKRTYFKPAIFLPFDSGSNAHLADPRQLLLNAENTYVNLKKMVERLEIFNANLQGQFNDSEQRYYRVVKTKEEVYDIISTGFLRRKNWKELPHGCSLRSTWNLFWSWSKPDIDISKLLVWQRINHFPFNKNLSRKDLLYKNLDSFRKMLKIPFNFLPLTFNLPKEYTQFSMKFHEQEIVNKDRNYWIMKPIGKSRGRGIKVISNLADLSYTDNIVVQKYITNPLLLDGYKFDMRIYVLVTNFHPLQAFVYKEGFARLSTEKFSLDPICMKNAFVHLTNFAINKNNEEAKQSANFSGGSKISLKILKDRLTKMNYSFNSIWSQVNEIIIKSLLGCSVSVPPFPTAFQLFGYDIMIDTDSNCHLIEINASPSLERTYMIDEVVKQSLIDDILDIVDPPQFDKEQLLDILSERLAGKKKITPDQDLIAIARVLKYKKMRKLGEIPDSIGLFEMIAPSKLSTDLQKLIKGRSGANNPRNID